LWRTGPGGVVAVSKKASSAGKEAFKCPQPAAHFLEIIALNAPDSSWHSAESAHSKS